LNIQVYDMTTRPNPICVALDTPDLGRAEQLARSLKGKVGMMKVGMEFFYAHGVIGYRQVAQQGVPIFLDLKLHDIPNTVAAGLRALMQLEPKPLIVNVHATGGPGMLRAAADAIDGRAKLIAVTILTSLDNDDLLKAGFNNGLDTRGHAVRLAELAKANGIDGVVCSPLDLTGIRKACGGDFLTVVPGIRPQGADVQDQKRVATPRTAIEAGADILVIGRAITGSDDPAGAAEQILESLSS
jgi:orotidine-5'-phosphate decarboxylase